MIKIENKKVSKEFLNYLKDTPMIPLTKNQIHTQAKYQSPIQSYKDNGPIEGDFSRISSCYIIQNNQLKKKQPVYCKQRMMNKHNQIFQEQDQNQQIQRIKMIAKLEFLQKKGYLKPEQKMHLEQLRGPRNTVIEQTQSHKQSLNKPMMANNQFAYKSNDENLNPNMYFVQDQKSYKHSPQLIGGNSYYSDPYSKVRGHEGKYCYGQNQFNYTGMNNGMQYSANNNMRYPMSNNGMQHPYSQNQFNSYF